MVTDIIVEAPIRVSAASGFIPADWRAATRVRRLGSLRRFTLHTSCAAEMPRASGLGRFRLARGAQARLPVCRAAGVSVCIEPRACIADSRQGRAPVRGRRD